jgi:hypothetical protein
MKQKYLLFGAAILIIMSLRVHAQDSMKVESQLSVKPIPVVDALQSGLVELQIKGEADSVQLDVSRISEDNDILILFPAGLTMLGFINGKQNVEATSVFSPDHTEFSLYGTIVTDRLAGESFSLHMKQDTLIVFEKGKSSASIKAEGSLSLKIPSGYTGFFLSGLSGTVTDGAISFQPTSEGGKKEIRIRYVNMKIKM